MTEIILAKVKKEIQEGNNQRPAIIFWKSNYSLSVLICFYELLSNVKFRTNHRTNPTRLTNKGFTSQHCISLPTSKLVQYALLTQFSYTSTHCIFFLQLHSKFLYFQRQKIKKKKYGAQEVSYATEQTPVVGRLKK